MNRLDQVLSAPPSGREDAIIRDERAQRAIPEPDEDVVTDYFFTFGSGHKLIITPAYGGQPQGTGLSLGRHYVVIKGTRESSLARFCEVFGATSFAFQYASAKDACIDTWRLTRLELPGLLP